VGSSEPVSQLRVLLALLGVAVEAKQDLQCIRSELRLSVKCQCCRRRKQKSST
jgi:hypothetical protein